jgi:hypothetical protein
MSMFVFEVTAAAHISNLSTSLYEEQMAVKSIN